MIPLRDKEIYKSIVEDTKLFPQTETVVLSTTNPNLNMIYWVPFLDEYTEKIIELVYDQEEKIANTILDFRSALAGFYTQSATGATLFSYIPLGIPKFKLDYLLMVICHYMEWEDAGKVVSFIDYLKEKN